VSPKHTLALLGVLTAALAWFCFTSLELVSEITEFLPAARDSPEAVLSRKLADSALTRSFVLEIEARDSETAVAAATELADALAAAPEIERVHRGGPANVGQTLYELYFPRRWMMLSDEPEREIPMLVSEQGLVQAIQNLKHQLSLPASAWLKRIVPEDPLLAFPQQLERMSRLDAEGTRYIQGTRVSEDGRHAYVFATTLSSPFASARQRPVFELIDQTFKDLDARHNGELQLRHSGIHAFALRSENTVRNDIQRISTISTVGVVVLLALVYRSVRLVFLGAVPLVLGILVATATCLVIFGPIHGLTFAFGVTLIGVCIDYPVHLFSHHLIAGRSGDGWVSLRAVWSALRLGALTTVAGFVVLAWASFSGLQQIGVFAAVGVMTALVCTRWLIPPLLPARVPPPRLLGKLATGCTTVLDRALAGSRRPLAAGLFGAVLLATFGLSRVRWIDDLRELGELDPELVQEDALVRSRVSPMDPGRFVVVIGANEQQALQRNDDVYRKLLEARDAGVLDAFVSLHEIVWSAQLQQRNVEVLASQRELVPRLFTALEREGFRAEAFTRLDISPSTTPLTPSLLETTSLGPLVGMFRINLPNEVAIITPVRGVHDTTALMGAISPVPGAAYFDQARFLADAYRAFRKRTILLLTAGLGLVFLLLLLRYRRARVALAAFVPAITAGILTLGMFGLVGRPVHLMHVMAVLLVLSMGVDYGVFLAEARDNRETLGATLVGLGIACTTTVLSFGLLALSRTPAMHALGSTIALGVSLGLLLAPLALVLLPRSVSTSSRSSGSA